MGLRPKRSRQDRNYRFSLGRDESTVYRWLKRYKQGGIDALLEVKTAPGKSGLISETVISQLHERLGQPQGFRSYSQIHSLAESRVRFVVVAYKTVHAHCAHKIMPN
ncbi:helix-turn-helix domain-containing protein [Tolypothrix sp. VBCCA 56010]|uniref:helix-turn-helix domain-containing protein n=1 Tax=Tolypothrix sp. VBCCA 56010 TaxID=3137731 RepID=UPI003D7DF606